MEEYINFKNVNCKDCYKCLRNCPVKSMRFTNHQAEIIENECILCGNCYLSCPQGAKEIRSDIDKVKALFKTEQEVYVSLAPSFIANFTGSSFEDIKEALQKLGFKDVEETAIGAEIVTKEYERIIDEGQQHIIISTCCPSVNLLIRKYYPDSVKYMAPVITPMIAHARKIKQEHKNCSVVFIGPCLSKKQEVDENLDVIDVALTYKELSAWLESENITVNKTKHLDKPKYLTRLYPTSSGIIKTMKKNPKFSYFALDGIEQCKKALDEISASNITNCFIEMSSCIGSCIGGPGIEHTKPSIIQSNFCVFDYAGDEMYHPRNIEATKKYQATPLENEKVPDEIVKMLLAKIGKNKPEDELNCGSCGYNTCKEKAYAMYYGKTEPSMCLPYLKNKALSYMEDIVSNTPNGIIVLNERLEIELINKSACDIIRVNKPNDVINQPVVRILDPTLYLSVLNNKNNIYNNRTYFTEYGKYVEQNIVYDASFKVVIIIMRDITDEVKEKEDRERKSRETILVTDKVVEKQMRAVQEIASLLGETTAETKVALEKLKEFLSDK